MARKERLRRVHNRIWFAAAAVLLTVLAFCCAVDFMPESVALEQEVRCGIEEHVHRDECYLDDLLICGRKAHTHQDSCYLISLKNNDINSLLTALSQQKTDKSLEGLLSRLLTSALSGTDSASDTGSVTAMLHSGISISELNKLLTDSGSSVQLNVDLAVVSVAPIVDEDPSTSSTAANIYVWFVNENDTGSWEFIGSLSHTQQRVNDGRRRVITRSELAELINDSLPGLSYAASNLPTCYHANSPTSSSWTESQTNNTYIAVRDNRNEQTRYVRLGGNGNNPDLKFVRVSYVYPDGYTGPQSTSPIYMTLGTSHKLPTLVGNYVWQDQDGNRYASGATVSSLTKSLIFTAIPNICTITWVNDDGNVLEIDTNVAYSSIPSYDGPTPTKTEDAQYTYSFAGWSPAISAVTGDATYTATYTPTLKTYTITWKDEDGTVLETDYNIPYGSTPNYNGATPTKTGNAQYSYPFTGWSPTVSTVTGDATYTATYTQTVNTYTVTFETDGGSTVAQQTVTYGGKATEPTAPTMTGYTFGGWYTTDGNEYDFSTPVTADITLYAKWTADPYTLILIDEDGNESARSIMYGDPLTLPALKDGYSWTNGTNAFPGGTTITDYSILAIDTANKTITFQATNLVTATYVYKDGTTASDSVLPGETVTLPDNIASGRVWLGSDGVTYQPGATVTLHENMTFTEKSTLTVTYNVNFSDSGLTSSTPPTLAENGLSTATVTVVEGTSASLYTVDPRTYISSLTGGEAAYFLGWVPASDSSALFAPATILTWEVLEQYAVNGTVALTGDWNRDSTNNTTDVRFYIRYDSIAPDISGNVGSYGTNFYTSQIYLAYVGNAPDSGFTIADKTADNSYAADRAIRALVGDKGDGELWISGVPDDAWLLEQLVTFTKENQTTTQVNNNEYLRIHVGKDANGNDVYEDVLASELDTDHYSIRWYVFKKEGDGWHADGRLVKKKGQFTVDKIFGGVEDAVEQTRDGFYILAENGTVTDGVFTPYDENDSRYNAHILALNPHSTTDAGAARIAEVQAKYPKAVLQLYNSEENIEGEIVDEWLVSDVEVNEMWRFTEYAVAPTYQDVSGNDVHYSWYAEYTVTDSDGEYSQVAQFGSVAQVLGKTYAMDADSDQGLTVDFTNYYYSNESILIRKIDGDTGQPLGGAEFQLWQPSATSNGEFLQLKFSDSGNGIYTVSPTGTIGSIITNAEGFSVITIDGFSFDSGPLLIKEVTAPSGYAVVNDITIDYTGEVDSTGTKLAGITAITGADQADFNYHAEYYNENGGVLVVKDHAAAYTSVTVNKVWADAVRENSVTVVLQANGNNAGALFPHLTGHQVTLNADNGWTHTWTDLPAYANGDPVEWSVKEILVGNNTTMVGSDAFANWIVNYSVPVRTDRDGDGVTDNWAITVTNTVRRTMLNITKTDLAGTTALSGAQFTLTEVEWNGSAWTDKQGASTLTATTGTDGRLIFDNLTAGAFYRLTETVAPAGYLLSQADTVFTVNGTGVVYGVTDGQADSTTLNTDYVDYTNPYNLTVKNQSMPELPSTGGTGTTVYAQAGFLLMLAALTLLVYKKKKGEGGRCF